MTVDSPAPRARVLFPNFGTVLLSALTAATVVCVAAFFDEFTSSRVLLILIALLGLHCLICPRILVCREFAIYAAFVGYLFLSLFWTPDGVLGMNTLFPAVDFLLVLLLLGSLYAFHDLRAVTVGTLIGFWVAAGAYTYLVGFPFVYPQGFSYNGVAMMYVFGLFSTLLFGWATGSRTPAMVGSVVILAHILATTSIKTNLGLVLGVVCVGLFYFRQSMRALGRNLIFIALIVAAGGYAVATNKAILERVSGGAERIAVGLTVLNSREDAEGYQGFGEREYWMREGIDGWRRNFLFGHGVEAFRAKYGITSHSTPVDLLYNTGLIGFGLFYAMFASLGLRVIQRRSHSIGLQAIVIAGLVCYLFMGLSGTVFYHVLVATYVAASAALLHRVRREREIVVVPAGPSFQRSAAAAN